MIFEEQISLKPDLYPWAREYCKAMHAGFWTSDEFSFKTDVQDFKTKLSEEEKEVIKKTLSLTSQVEVAVKLFWGSLGRNLPHPSLIDLGFVMSNVEVIHNHAYSKLLEVLDMNEVFESNLKLDIVSNRVKYLRKYNHKYYSDSKKQYIYALILFTIFVENISLFSQFYTINWFCRFKNVLKDTGQQTNYTLREEGLHFLAGVKIINTIKSEYPELFDKELEERIIHECQEAIRSEIKLINWFLNGYKQENLSSEILEEFIKDRINDSLIQIGYKPPFEINKELLSKTNWFNEESLGNNFSDFFFRKPTDYSQKSQVFNGDELFS